MQSTATLFSKAIFPKIVLDTIVTNMQQRVKTTYVKCLIDSGSQRSYLSEGVLQRLNLSTPKNEKKLLVNTFLDSSHKSFTECSLLINFQENRDTLMQFLISRDFDISYSIDGLKMAFDNISAHHKMADVCHQDEIHLEGLIGVDGIQLIRNFAFVPLLGGIGIRLSSGVVPIGNVDSFLNSAQLEEKYSKQSASESNIGTQVDSSMVNFLVDPVKTGIDPLGSVAHESMVDDRIDNLFKVESLGISEPVSEIDENFIEDFDQNIELIEGKYHVKLPWYENVKEVKNNYHICSAVLDRVLVKLENDGLYDKYNSVFEQQLTDGIIEEVSLEGLDINEHTFVPHRPVIKYDDTATTKTRIVLNCSFSTGKSPSLNQAAYPGINLLNNLLELLLKLRTFCYVAIADLKQAYLMIKLKEIADRNRFTVLWRDRTGKLIVYRYKSLVFGFVSSSFILSHVLSHHLNKYDYDVCTEALINNMYVDNFLFTHNDAEQVVQVYSQARQRMAEAGFDLRSWATNCEALQQRIDEDGCGVTHSSPYEKILGYNYSASKDELSVVGVEVISNGPITKRILLSKISSVFDPLGLLNPILVRSKILMQRVWQSKITWDDELDLDCMREWTQIESDLNLLDQMKFPRYVCNENSTLYIFCDSSKHVYGFVCFARCEMNDSYKSNLIFSKCRNAPTKSKTLPTLELMSAFLAFKCLASILRSIPSVKEVYIALDSQIALNWILSGELKSSNKNQFARNRVKEICHLKNEIKDEFNVECKLKYVPSEQNVADLITRGLTYQELTNKINFWKFGPEFLNKKDVIWPVNDLGCLSDANKILVNTVLVDEVQPLVNADRFSDINKLLRVSVLVLRAISRMRRRPVDGSDLMNQSKINLLKFEQFKHFPNEVNFLNKKSEVAPNRVRDLNLFLDEHGLLRSRGRLAKSTHCDYNVNNPLLLPKSSHVTKLYIKYFHEKNMHLGVQVTLNATRQAGFYIQQGRSAVKSVNRKCFICRKINSFAFRSPKSNDLIKDRVQVTRPFENTGVDYTGHVFVKNGDGYTKMYLLIFTCLCIRAVHIELVPSMTCKDFLLAMVRFVNLFSVPKALYSDNASTFMQAMGILSKTHIDNDFTAYLAKHSIRHVRIPIRAAWYGAMWERMIKTIKSCLYKTLGRKRVPYFELITVLSDIEVAINSRPLTYYDDENLTVISPNNFLKPLAGTNLLFGDVSGSQLETPSRSEFVAALRRREDILSAYKDLWKETYLLSLREGAKSTKRDTIPDQVKPGDVVLIHTPMKSRTFWNLGKVIQPLPGPDGQTRCAKVMRPDRSEGVYSIEHLYPMELSITPEESISPALEAQTSQTLPKPKRRAAIEALSRITNSNQ